MPHLTCKLNMYLPGSGQEPEIVGAGSNVGEGDYEFLGKSCQFCSSVGVECDLLLGRGSKIFGGSHPSRNSLNPRFEKTNQINIIHYWLVVGQTPLKNMS